MKNLDYPKNLHVLLYARVSKRELFLEPNYLKNQKRQMKRFCIRHELIPMAGFADVDEGQNSKRPGWQMLLDYLTNYPYSIDVVLCVSLGRICTNRSVQTRMINDLYRRHYVLTDSVFDPLVKEIKQKNKPQKKQKQ